MKTKRSHEKRGIESKSHRGKVQRDERAKAAALALAATTPAPEGDVASRAAKLLSELEIPATTPHLGLARQLLILQDRMESGEGNLGVLAKVANATREQLDAAAVKAKQDREIAQIRSRSLASRAPVVASAPRPLRPELARAAASFETPIYDGNEDLNASFVTPAEDPEKMEQIGLCGKDWVRPDEWARYELWLSGKAPTTTAPDSAQKESR